jgi:hypothetical protein
MVPENREICDQRVIDMDNAVKTNASFGEDLKAIDLPLIKRTVY